MDRKAAKELLHIKGWLERVDEIVERGREAYLADDLLQEAGDSLMMKLGEAANRLSRLGVLAPDGVEWALAVANRNFLIHQYDDITANSPGSRSPGISPHGGSRCIPSSRPPTRSWMRTGCNERHRSLGSRLPPRPPSTKPRCRKRRRPLATCSDD